MKNENREQKIKRAYKQNADRYDNYIASRTLWARLVVKIIWNLRDADYVKLLLSLIPDDFRGKLLDVPVGTAIFTHEKYKKINKADIFCLDYSQEMLDYAQERFNSLNINNIKVVQGDVGDMSFDDNFFDIVLSMNGVHVFPNKQKSFSEIHRVLQPGGKFIGCFYIEGERKLTDFFVRNIFIRNGTFTPPFMTKKELELELKKHYKILKIWNIKSIVCFECVKK